LGVSQVGLSFNNKGLKKCINILTHPRHNRLYPIYNGSPWWIQRVFVHLR
ncbi:unnamed protein product, partial [Staurois parvus]